MTQLTARVLLWAHRRVALYGDTRYLLLCAHDERKSGRVTVGESRLPVAMVIAVIRAHGIAEAEIQWPQLAAEELSVLSQLAEDIAADERPEVDVLRGDLGAVLLPRLGDVETGLVVGRVLEVLAAHGVVDGDGDG